MTQSTVNPLHETVRNALRKGVETILTRGQPAEKADMVVILFTIVLGGGNRNESSLWPMHDALNNYLMRISGSTDDPDRLAEALITLYRRGMTLYHSTMEIFVPGFVDKQVRDGAERVDIIDSQIAPGGIDEGVIVTTIPAPKKA